jgi:hypothetical protein
MIVLLHNFKLNSLLGRLENGIGCGCVSLENLVSPLDDCLDVLQHFLERIVVLRLLYDLFVFEVVEAVRHSESNLVLVLEITHHQLEVEHLKLV